MKVFIFLVTSPHFNFDLDFVKPWKGLIFWTFYFGDDLAAAEIFAPRANFLLLWRQLCRAAPAAGMGPFLKLRLFALGLDRAQAFKKLSFRITKLD